MCVCVCTWGQQVEQPRLNSSSTAARSPRMQLRATALNPAVSTASKSAPRSSAPISPPMPGPVLAASSRARFGLDARLRRAEPALLGLLFALDLFNPQMSQTLQSQATWHVQLPGLRPVGWAALVRRGSRMWLPVRTDTAQKSWHDLCLEGAGSPSVGLGRLSVVPDGGLEVR